MNTVSERIVEAKTLITMIDEAEFNSILKFVAPKLLEPLDAQSIATLIETIFVIKTWSVADANSDVKQAAQDRRLKDAEKHYQMLHSLPSNPKYFH